MWNEIKRVDDESENVAKFVFTKPDAVVESVLYRYHTYEERTVICCSTQSGCPVGCRFCGTGDYFVRNLTTEEIVSQVDHCIDQTRIDSDFIMKLQIMFMSMGEPLLNLKALIPAIEILNEKYPQAALLISTSGPDIGDDGWNRLIDLSMRIPKVGLQFSVHESTDESRNKLIPFKKKLDLAGIAREGTAWAYNTRRPAFFNYCAHETNSTDADADRLRDLFDPKYFNATVSVICERNEGLPATNDFQRQLAIDFSEKLVIRGFDVRVFDPAGQDTIGGGCGQLPHVQRWFKDNPDKIKKSVGYGQPILHTPGGPFGFSDKS